MFPFAALNYINNLVEKKRKPQQYFNWQLKKNNNIVLIFWAPMFFTRKHFGGAHSKMATCSINGDSADEINDPGAAPYGNFINYYTFNPPENRLSLIPATLLQDLGFSDGRQTTLILDVGCNSGVCGAHIHIDGVLVKGLL